MQELTRILAINLGSTSSEIGYLNGAAVHSHKVRHTETLLALPVSEQLEPRTTDILNWLEAEGVQLDQLDAVACRGGRLKPIASGVYAVNEELLADSEKTEDGDHASRLSVFIGTKIATKSKCPVFVVDPISVDEYSEVARLTGIKGVKRRCLGHALNSKYVFRKIVEDLGLDPQCSNVIVVHMGGGASVSLHQNGKMVDLINDFEGAFTPERAGGLPTTIMMKLFQTTPLPQISRWLEGEGGFFSYLETKQFDVICAMANDGHSEAKLLLDGYLYQQKKSIGSLLGVVDMKIDGIALTGGIAHNRLVTDSLQASFGNVARVLVYPGSFEMEALIFETRAALIGERAILSYPDGGAM